jgi:hypothetical protein
MFEEHVGATSRVTANGERREKDVRNSGFISEMISDYVIPHDTLYL